MFTRRRFWSWAAVVAGWIAVVTALWLALTATPLPELREHLKHVQFWALEVLFVILVLTTIANAPSLVRALRPVRFWSLPVIAASVLALLLTTAVAPRTNRIYYDEQIISTSGKTSATFASRKCVTRGPLNTASSDVTGANTTNSPTAIRTS